MAADPQPRLRSLLFAPGNQPRKLQRVFEFGADAVDLDLEDAVPVAEKATARTMVKETLLQRAGQPGPRIVVRCNGPETGLTEDDLVAAVQPGIFAVHLTKLGSPGVIPKYDRLVTELERERGIPVGSVRMITSVDSAGLVLALPELARSSKRLYCFILGGADFAYDLDVDVSTDMVESLWSRSYGVLVSRANGLAGPLHPPYFDFSDDEGLRRILTVGRKLGFQGGVVLHPKHLPLVHEVFAPSAREVQWAKDVTAAYRAAEAQGKGSLQMADGTFADVAMVKRAERILGLAGGGGAQ